MKRTPRRLFTEEFKREAMNRPGFSGDYLV